MPRECADWHGGLSGQSNGGFFGRAQVEQVMLCEHCHGKGIQIYEEGQVKGNYRYIQLINRKDKDYRQQGF